MREVNIINEKAIYKLAFKSRKKEAEEFQDWVKVLDDVVDLMIAKERFGLDISVSETIYKNITH